MMHSRSTQDAVDVAPVCGGVVGLHGSVRGVRAVTDRMLAARRPEAVGGDDRAQQVVTHDSPQHSGAGGDDGSRSSQARAATAAS